jgi:hypothetical protein
MFSSVQVEKLEGIKEREISDVPKLGANQIEHPGTNQKELLGANHIEQPGSIQPPNPAAAQPAAVKPAAVQSGGAQPASIQSGAVQPGAEPLEYEYYYVEGKLFYL